MSTATARSDDAGARETWTVARALTWMKERFTSRGIDSARLDAELLLASVLGCDRIGVITRAEQPLNAQERNTLRELVRRRQQREPVAYILGSKGFRDIDLTVGPGVLVPRPETEFVIDTCLTLDQAGELPSGPVVDLGTGSGAIAIVLARLWPDRVVHAVERSDAAITIARQNIEALDAGVLLHHGDWNEVTPGGLALAVSNPPYVAASDADALQADLAFEPAEALFAGTDGLDAYRVLAPLLAESLLPGGWWVSEVGQGQRPAIETLLNSSDWTEPRWTADYNGIDRVFATRRRPTDGSKNG